MWMVSENIYNFISICSFAEDEQFNDEKTYLIKQIKELHPA